MRGNDGREFARHRFLTRTLEVLRSGGSVTGDRVEDWRRVTRQLGLLWQMANAGEFRLSVSGLELVSLEAEALEPAPAGRPAGTGPRGGDLIHPWQATYGNWVSVPDGPSGPLAEASMAMPDQEGVARTVVIVDQWHRVNPDGAPHADVLIDSDALIERLDAEAEHARAREQWIEDRRRWHAR
ncbi:hypothetical protein OG800_50660 (plasmid) [Streptomyces sp. NBC_00445]|uniref:hypothetical protein n=1 Tax=Streptomyces sp. NBC_00445 TaxID=2975745 RepID=UPI002E1CB87A